MRETISNILLGLLLVALGVVTAGNALDLWYIPLAFQGWWTLFIIIPCLYSMIRGVNFSNVAGVVIGVLLLLGAQDIVDFDLVSRLIFPIVLVMIGLSVIFAGKFRRKGRSCRNIGKGGMLECVAIFSGREDVIGADEAFHGASVVAIFGGAELDLRNAVITEDIVINVTAIFGGVDIFVPSNVKVRTNVAGIFGGTDDKSQTDPLAENTIFFDGACIFGGSTIK